MHNLHPDHVRAGSASHPKFARRAGRALSSVNLSGNMRDSPLINRRSIPSLDSAEIGFARLVSPTSAPAMSPEEISRGSQGVGGVIEIAAGAVVQDALGQELCLADLPVH